jgi:hypothetical protein
MDESEQRFQTRWWNVPAELGHEHAGAFKPRVRRGIELADVERAIIGDEETPGIAEDWERSQLLEQVYRLAELYEQRAGGQAG